nr:hypothetical protein [Cellvibrionaceae bacterium]
MNNLLEQAFLQVNIGILVIDKAHNIILCNNFMQDYTQKNNDDIISHNLFTVYPKLPQAWLKRRINNIFLLKNSSFISWEQRPSLFNFPNSRPITGNRQDMIQNCSLLPIFSENNEVTHVCITTHDATATALSQSQIKKTSKRLAEEKKAQQALISKLEETKDQLLQSEKMASIGQLAAGVAHEINNPVGFIKSNFNSLKRYAKELNTVIQKHHHLLQASDDNENQQRLTAINEEHDIEFITEDINNLLKESFDGINRIEDIVKSLKYFSREDSKQWEEADINAGIESTLKIVSHEIKYIATIEKNYQQLPKVQCLPMQINQVFMNLLVNAAHAIEPTNTSGKISISTSAQQTYVTIAISDNGKGIEKVNIVKIFDPFFTTKPVGKGTGLGLSLSYNIIQEHGGEISV